MMKRTFIRSLLAAALWISGTSAASFAEHTTEREIVWDNSNAHSDSFTFADEGGLLHGLRAELSSEDLSITGTRSVAVVLVNVADLPAALTMEQAHASL